MSAQHTQEPVAILIPTYDGNSYQSLNGHMPSEVTLLYAFPPDAAARIAELEAYGRTRADEMLAATVRITELEKQRNTLLAAAQQAANEIRKCDYTPARSTLLTAIASVKEQA